MSGLARSRLEEAFTALRDDLVQEGGPRISTMRNHRFAIVPYPPEAEFEVRARVQRLIAELVGWRVLTLDLQQLLLARIRALGAPTLARLVEMEKRAAAIAPDRGLSVARTHLTRLVEGPDGIAADCATAIAAHLDASPDEVDRTLVLLGRAGALYPFFRTSALLRHLDGKTRNAPVVLLYPGERRGETGLSFMGELEPDRDYRPRIYP